jgi:hypothetical protein
MNTPPADSHFGFISPLAPQLARFLALKHAIGHRYREEGRVLHDLDCFLNSRLSANDPVITSAMVHDYVARRGDESETTRAHRLTLIREVCRLLRLDNARVVVLGFLAATRVGVSCKHVLNCHRDGHHRYARLSLAPHCAFCIWSDCGPGSY